MKKWLDKWVVTAGLLVAIGGGLLLRVTYAAEAPATNFATGLLGLLDCTTCATVDSNLNGLAGGQAQKFTITHVSLVYTAGTGTGGPIQIECAGLTSGKRCFADVSCNGTNFGYDGGTFISVPTYGYSGSTGCAFSGEMVYCLGRNTPQDGGTDCTLDPVAERVRIEGKTQ